jgi:hypothetical protein
MTSTTLDITTIHAATNAVVKAMESAVCQWEQQCEDAVQDGNLTSALMYRNWAFAPTSWPKLQFQPSAR